MESIKDLTITERPRERLTSKGAAALSDTELLSIIIGSGINGSGVRQLSKKVLEVLDANNCRLTPKELATIHGIGNAKSALICAALEFARRRIRPDGNKIKEASDIYPLIRHFAERKQEHFISISLNGAHEVLSIRVVTIGLLNSTQVHPREVFAEALSERAAAIIVAHNHPSGQLTPSTEDIKVTKNLVEASKIIGITLLDHIIFTSKGFVSLQEMKMMEG